MSLVVVGKNNMLLIYLGLYYDFEREQLYSSHSKIALPNAINTFQTNLIEGLKENCNSLYLLNTLPFGTFPKAYNRIILFSENVSSSKNLSEEYIGYINLPLIKQLSRKINYWNAIKKVIDNFEGNISILAYSMYEPFLSVMTKSKRYSNKVKTCIIVPDLPSIYGILPHNIVKKVLINIYGTLTLIKAKKMDSYIFFTKHMNEVVNVAGKPFILIEGISGNASNQNIMPIGTKRIILYTGSLRFIFGIKTLIDAFLLIDDMKYELWICGCGEAEEEIIKASQLDKRIKYLGFVTKKEVQKLTNQAHILVNPRPNGPLYTKYSFPSKTIEYLMSGKPVIMHKLHGLPNEYKDYLFLLEDLSADTLKNKILEVGDMSNEEIYEYGKRARQWVIDNKSPKIQGEKIINFIKGTFSE